MPKLSVVISTLDRSGLLETTLFSLTRWQRYDPDQVELVLVIDVPADRKKFLEVVTRYRKYFYKTTLIHIDSHQLSPVQPVGPCGNPSLGVNIGVKAAENEIILKTDAECLPITDTIRESLNLYRADRLLFFSVRMLTEHETDLIGLGNMLTLHPNTIYETSMKQLPGLWAIDERSRYGYWFGAVFSRTKFLQIGGVDEQFMKGFAGEDDEWAERMRRHGVNWHWSDNVRILHQYHGNDNRTWIHSKQHYHNIDRLNWSRDASAMYANIGSDWGSDTVKLFQTELCR